VKISSLINDELKLFAMEEREIILNGNLRKLLFKFSMPASDFLSTVMTLFFIAYELKQINKLQLKDNF